MSADPQATASEVTPYPERKRGIWHHLGGGALSVAIILHVVILLVGAVWVFQVTIEPEKVVDFLPGNGQAGGSERGLQHQLKQKKMAQITPSTNVKRVFAEGAVSSFTLPDPGDSFGEMSTLSSLGGGGISGGLGGSGGGAGFGLGGGAGAGGAGLQPIMMFGLQLEDTRKIGVVMDVSRSMTKYLPIVATELDKITARGPLILYFGCGMANPPKKGKIDADVKLANGPAFDRFWQLGQGKTDLKRFFNDYKNLKYNPEEKMPLSQIHKQMSDRLDTYYVEFNGINYTQTAILCRQLRDVDTIYWFADFQDKADAEQMKLVLRKLKSNKQKIVMHATVKGRFFEQVRDGLVLPSGGTATVKDVK